VLDVELKAVDQLGIRKDLSKPATYVIDKEGKLRYAYVGKTLADRPSVKAILAELDQINRP
jgi:peroxiredoxin